VGGMERYVQCSILSPRTGLIYGNVQETSVEETDSG